jgi:hypothetical protein
MKTFDDLIFNENNITGFGTKKSAKLKLDNGVIVSVVGGYGVYGNGIDSFEIAAWHDSDKNNFIRLSEYDDVLGWLSKEQVTTKINELSKL